MRSLIFRIVRQMMHDKRSLALLIFAPIFIMSLLYLLLGESKYTPSISVASDFPNVIRVAMEEQDADVVLQSSIEDALLLLSNNEVDAVVSFDESGMNVVMLESGGIKTAKVSDVIRNAMKKVNPSAGLSMSFVYGKTEGSTFDGIGYMLLGVMSFFIVFMLSGISFVRERTTGTMERLMLTPISRWKVVSGYTVGFGIFAVLQSLILVFFSEYVLDMQFNGSFIYVLIIMVMLAMTAVCMGTLLSIFANNEFQMVQFIPVIIIPQIFFSGLIPIDTFPSHLGLLSYTMPIFYACTGLKEVILRGGGFEDIQWTLVALGVYILVLSVMNNFALMKYRKI